MQELIDKARVLIEALPFISEFRGKTVVVKIGGAALEDEVLRKRFCEDLLLLDWVGINLVVVHGGGKQISAMLERLGIEPKFDRGIRITDDATLQVAEMVLAGPINSDIVRLINHLGGAAVGLSGCDGGLASARITDPSLGRVGEVTTIDRLVIDRLIGEFIPVIAPIATDQHGQPLNVNADVFAAKLAAALGAEKLVLLTDIPGVLDADRKLISTITPHSAAQLIVAGVITGGMIPKVENAVATLAAGVTKVHIIDGRVEHALLLEIFTSQGVGTQLVPDGNHTPHDSYV